MDDETKLHDGELEFLIQLVETFQKFHELLAALGIGEFHNVALEDLISKLKKMQVSLETE